MISELDALAERLRQVADLVGQLREENRQLRAQVVEHSAARQAAEHRIDGATQRIDTLLAALPELNHPPARP